MWLTVLDRAELNLWYNANTTAERSSVNRLLSVKIRFVMSSSVIWNRFSQKCLICYDVLILSQITVPEYIQIPWCVARLCRQNLQPNFRTYLSHFPRQCQTQSVRQENCLSYFTFLRSHVFPFPRVLIGGLKSCLCDWLLFMFPSSSCRVIQRKT